MTFTVAIWERRRTGMVLLEEHEFTRYAEAARFAGDVQAEGGHLFVDIERGDE
jgi:hypothetical protein